MDTFSRLRGGNAQNHQPKEDELSRTSIRVDDPQDKKAVIHDQISRISELPANSSYANHRLLVFNKILSLLCLQKITSEDEELELLFAGLSM